MKTVRIIKLRSLTDELIAELKERKLYIKPDDLGYFTFTNWTDERIARFIETVQKYGVEWENRVAYNIYERQDIEKIEAVHVWVFLPYVKVSLDPHLNFTNPAFDHEHACQRCGMPQRQIGPLHVKCKGPLPKKRTIFEPVGDAAWLIKDELKEMMEKEKFTGLSFRQVIAHKTGMPVPGLWQMFPDSELPTILDKEYYERFGISKNCSCEQPLVNRKNRQLIKYPVKIRDYLMDFNRTGEWFDISHGRYVLSSRMAIWLIDNKVGNILFEPVIIES